jgi:hypothetical protein
VESKTVAYIKHNFITIEQLSDKAGVDIEFIKEMIATKCLPTHSYEIDSTVHVASSISTEEYQVKVGYFSKSSILKVREIISLLDKNFSLDDISPKLKNGFKTSYLRLFKEMNAYKNGFEKYFLDEKTLDDEKIKLFLNREWRAYLDGTYGIALNTISVKDIVKQKIMIGKIKRLSKLGKNISYSERDELLEAMKTLDVISTKFSPMERSKSLRYKYIDKLVDKFQFGDEIFIYNYENL